MSFPAQVDLLTAILALVLALSVALRRRPHRQQVLFSAAAFTFCFFHLFGFMHQLGAEGWWPGLWERLQYSAAALIPLALTFLMGTFLPENQTFGRGLYTLQFVFSPIFIIGTMSPLLYRHPYFPASLGVYVYATAGMACVGLLQGIWRTENENEKLRLAYLVTGGFITLVLEVFTNMDNTRPYVPAVGNAALIIYLYFLSQAVIEYRVMGLRDLLGKAVVLSSLALVLTSIYSILLVLVGNEKYLMFMNTLVASFVILVLFDPLRTALEGLASRLIPMRRFELARRLQALRREMANVFDPAEMTELVLDSLWASRRVSNAGVYLPAGDAVGFRLAGHRGPPLPERMDAASHRAVLEQLQEHRTPLLLEMVERRALDEEAGGEKPADGGAQWAEVAAGMKAAGANIVLPLLAGGEVAGILTLNDVRTAESFSAEELSLLMQIAEQAGVTLENYRLFERAKERDRLAAIGEMAAGLAHEIRNPLGAIKGAAQYLDPKSLPGKEGEFLGIIIEEVDRLNRVLAQFLDYSRPWKGNVSRVDINDVVESTIRLLSPQIPASVNLSVRLADTLPAVSGDAEQLRQVLINLVHNAVSAMPEGGTLSIATSSRLSGLERLGKIADLIRQGFSASASVSIAVSDTGTGIPPENLPKIFIPFFTSRKDGTGLGLAICQKIVKNHSGDIEVKSEHGKGSTFIIRLPAAPPQKVPEAGEGVGTAV